MCLNFISCKSGQPDVVELSFGTSVGVADVCTSRGCGFFYDSCRMRFISAFAGAACGAT